METNIYKLLMNTQKKHGLEPCFHIKGLGIIGVT